MANNFDTFFAGVLKDEGTTFEDVAGDNGGPTRCGVTIFDVARFNGVTVPSNLSALRQCSAYPSLLQGVKDLTPDSARPIYKRYYWSDVRGDDLPSGIDLVVADYATNSGESKAVATLASLVGLNGHTLTDEILAAVTQADAADLINRFQNARRDFLIEISTPPRYAHNAKFRAGWLARVERIRKSALALVGTEPPLHQGIPTPKAVPLDTPIEPLASANPMVSAATSPTVLSILGAAWASVYGGFEKAVDFATGLVSNAGDIKADADQAAEPIMSILSTCKVNAAEIGTVIAVVCLGIAIIRHVDLKTGTVKS